MSKHEFNKRFDSRNVPEGKLGPIENGMPTDINKHITIRPLLDEANEAEKRALRR